MASPVVALSQHAVPAFRAVTRVKPHIYWPHVICDAIPRGDLDNIKSAIYYATRDRQPIDWIATINAAIDCMNLEKTHAIIKCAIDAQQPVSWTTAINIAVSRGEVGLEESRHRCGEVGLVSDMIKFALDKKQRIDWTSVINAVTQHDRLDVIVPVVREIALNGAMDHVDWDAVMNVAARSGSAKMFGIILRIICEYRVSCIITE